MAVEQAIRDGSQVTSLLVTNASATTDTLKVYGDPSTHAIYVISAGTIPGTSTMVQGDVANGVTDAGNPVKIGGIAQTANPTAVTTGQRVNAWFSKTGKQVVMISAPRDLVVQQHTEIASSSVETTFLTAGASGIFHDITHLTITNQTATATNITIKDATSGTTRKIIALPASGGITEDFTVPWTQTTAANNWTATSSSAAVTIDIFVQAIKSI